MTKKFIPLLFLIACHTNGSKPTPEVVDTEWCKPAQIHLEELSISQRKAGNTKDAEICDLILNKTSKTKTEFYEVCENAQKNGIFFNPRQIAVVTKCADVDKVTNSKE